MLVLSSCSQTLPNIPAGGGGWRKIITIEKNDFSQTSSHQGDLIFVWAVLSFVRESEIHSYVAKHFLLFLWLKLSRAKSDLVQCGGLTSARENVVLELADSVFQLWFILTINTSAVDTSPSAASHGDSWPLTESHRQMTGTHSEQKDRSEERRCSLFVLQAR